jgi:hypothetical protein
MLRLYSGSLGRLVIACAATAFIAGGDANAQSVPSFLPVYERGEGILSVDLEIGGDIDDNDYLLYGPTRIAVDSRGNIFVLDSRQWCIKKFDPKGVYIRTIGRQGQGPGELSQTYQMVIDHSDNIVVYDLGNRRFSFFDNAGDYVRTVKYQPHVLAMQLGPDGSLYAEVEEMVFADAGAKMRIRMTRFSPDFKTNVVFDSLDVSRWKMIQTKSVTQSVTLPFYRYLVWQVAPCGRLVIGTSDSYDLRILSPDLAVIGEIHRDVERVKVTGQDKDDYFADFDEPLVPELRRAISFPKYKPIIDVINIDHEGYIIVRLEQRVDDKPVYDVFTPEGGFVNRVTVASLSRFAVMKSGFVYQRRFSQDELPSVCRYRLE